LLRSMPGRRNAGAKVGIAINVRYPRRQDHQDPRAGAGGAVR
jgi:hypothetical protein